MAAGLVAYYLWDSRGVEERATALARQACQQRRLQFLDFSVENQGTKPILAKGGQLVWQRSYIFEFTVGEEHRYGASLVMQGRKVASLQFDPHPEPDPDIEYAERGAQCMRR